MKVAIVCPDAYSVLLFCRGIIRALAQAQGVSEVIVVSADSGYKNQIEELGARSVGVEMHRYIHFVKDIKYMLALYKVFKQHRVDTVINISTKPNIYGTIAAKAAGVTSIVLHVLGLGTAFLDGHDIRSRLVRGAVLNLYRLAAHLSSKVWFTNNNDVAFFLQRGLINPGKVVLSKNYLDPTQYSPENVATEEVNTLKGELDLREGDQVVVMVARMIWPKGIKEFVEAAMLLRSRCPRVRFLLVAPLEPGNPDAVPESYARDAESRANFRWLGFRRDVKTIYMVSALAVLPTYYKEGGYPRALLEPMAMGKPVIAADCEDCKGAVEEGKNGYLVPPRNAKALADAIERIMTDPVRQARFGAYSRDKVFRDFDERKIVAQAIDALELFTYAQA